MKKVFFSHQVNAIADRTTKMKQPVKAAAAAPAPKPVPAAVARLLASIDRNLPLPPAGTKFSVESIDKLLAGKPVSERLRIKDALHRVGLI
jgi:hypothetical protein